MRFEIHKRFIVYIGVLSVPLLAFSQFAPFAFFQGSDPCEKTPSLGTVCWGGALYAGQFDGGKYMVTPSGCNDSSTPTCDGTVDSVKKKYHGSTGGYTDIPGVENVDFPPTKSSSSYRGDVNTAAMVAHGSIDSDSAGHFCDDMVYGGYSDWYLPSKSELAYLYCHADTSTHNTNHPQEDPDCTTYGGKTSELTGFASVVYWSSSEKDANDGWRMNMGHGFQSANSKSFNANERVRCIRRY